MRGRTRRLVRKVFTPTAVSGKLRGELRALADELVTAPAGAVGYVQRVLVDQLVANGFIREDDPAAPDYWQIIGALDARGLADALRAMAQNGSGRVLDFFKARLAYQRVCRLELREDRQALVEALTAQLVGDGGDGADLHLSLLSQSPGVPLERAARVVGVPYREAQERVTRLTGKAWRTLSPPSCAEAAVMAGMAGGLPPAEVAAALELPEGEVRQLWATLETRLGRLRVVASQSPAAGRAS